MLFFLGRYPWAASIGPTIDGRPQGGNATTEATVLSTVLQGDCYTSARCRSVQPLPTNDAGGLGSEHVFRNQ